MASLICDFFAHHDLVHIGATGIKTSFAIGVIKAPDTKKCVIKALLADEVYFLLKV